MTAVFVIVAAVAALGAVALELASCPLTERGASALAALWLVAMFATLGVLASRVWA